MKTTEDALQKATWCIDLGSKVTHLSVNGDDAVAMIKHNEIDILKGNFDLKEMKSRQIFSGNLNFYLSDTFTFPILRPLVPLFWISGDVSSGFQSQSGFCLI